MAVKHLCVRLVFAVTDQLLPGAPVRETLGSELGTGELPWLFAATFLTMLLLNPIYAMLVARVSRRALVHVTYRFFSLCLVAFWLLMNRESSPWVVRCFFVWVGVFNMFAVSIFWSFLADSFSSDQAKRLFGVIAAGGTIGGVVGSRRAAIGRTNWCCCPTAADSNCLAGGCHLIDDSLSPSGKKVLHN